MTKINSLFLSICLLGLLMTNSAFSQVENIGNDKFSIELEGNTLKIPFYANYDLFTTNPTISKAVVVIHGANQNADDYFENMEIAAASVSTLTENTLIVAPQFLTETDIDFHDLDAEHLYWTSGGWKSGSNSRNEADNLRPARIPAYAVMDSLLIHLAEQFPNLSTIVFTGHSAGGQVAQRMAATSPITDLLCTDFGVSMRFVVANPSSYVYMDNQRKVANSITEFEIPPNSCTTYNEWKYGLADLFTYPKSVGIPTIRSINKKNTVTYLLGENDDNPTASSLDNSCEANLQGAHRLERGIVYFNYLQEYYGAEITTTHDLVLVPNVGHNNFDMYNSIEGIEVLFERTKTTCANSVPIKEILTSPAITIYPNPTSDILTIRTPIILDKNIQLSVFDLHGYLWIRKTGDGAGQLDISSLKSGLYLLALSSEQRTIYKRFVVNSAN